MIEDTNFDQEPLAIKMEKKSAEKSANSKTGIIRKTSVDSVCYTNAFML